jgi:hypothetical protein
MRLSFSHFSVEARGADVLCKVFNLSRQQYQFTNSLIEATEHMVNKVDVTR